MSEWMTDLPDGEDDHAVRRDVRVKLEDGRVARGWYGRSSANWFVYLDEDGGWDDSIGVKVVGWKEIFDTLDAEDALRAELEQVKRERDTLLADLRGAAAGMLDYTDADPEVWRARIEYLLSMMGVVYGNDDSNNADAE